MKHLKSYNESKQVDISTIEDILLELKDDGFTTKVVTTGTNSYIPYPQITIVKVENSPMGGVSNYVNVEFKYSEIKDVVDNIIGYLGGSFIRSYFMSRNLSWYVIDVDNIDDSFQSLYGVIIEFN